MTRIRLPPSPELLLSFPRKQMAGHPIGIQPSQRKPEGLALQGEGRLHLDAANEHRPIDEGQTLKGQPMEVEGMQAMEIRKTLCQRPYGVKGRRAREIDPCGADPDLPDAPAVAFGGDITFRGLKSRQEPRLQVYTGKGRGEIKGSRSMFEVVHSLDVGNVAEEPAVAGLHEEGMPLHLQQLQRRGSLLTRWRSAGVGAEKRFNRGVAPIKEQGDVVVPCGPDIGEQPTRLFCEQPVQIVAKVVDS